MSEPEISRRCPECGASIRVRASFCPQCGRAFASAAEHHSKVSVHRATAAVRDVFEDNVLARVEKLRHVSSVVLDEAGYDPSLRFVLVAVVLFVLFLALLFLSKWLG